MMSLILMLVYSVYFFKQKTAYELRISDWSSDVCSSDLVEEEQPEKRHRDRDQRPGEFIGVGLDLVGHERRILAEVADHGVKHAPAGLRTALDFSGFPIEFRLNLFFGPRSKYPGGPLHYGEFALGFLDTAVDGFGQIG